jgi:hypothetical protein
MESPLLNIVCGADKITGQIKIVTIIYCTTPPYCRSFFLLESHQNDMAPQKLAKLFLPQRIYIKSILLNKQFSSIQKEDSSVKKWMALLGQILNLFSLFL